MKNKCRLKIDYLIISLICLICISSTSSLQLKDKVLLSNPDQPSADSGGGDGGEFLRRHQPQEHLIIPLINKVTGDYNPFFNLDIKKYRKEYTKLDKNIKFLAKLDKEGKKDEIPNYYYDIELDKGIDDDVNKIFKAEGI